MGKAVIALAVQAGVMVTLGMLLWHWSGRGLSDFVPFSLQDAFLGTGLGLALIAAAWTVFRILPRITEALVRMQAENYGFLGGQIGFPAIIVISLCAGIGEEALFRGGIQTFLGDQIGIPAAIGISSAAFAAIHLARPVISVMLFLIGALFGVIFWQTGSLLAVMIGHAVYDVWALRYLLNEFLRLGLVGEEAPPLANAPDPS